MLKIDELKVSYGGIEAVKGITFEVPERKIVTLIGANGAGKSTTLRTIAGLVKPAHGRIHLQGEDITSLSPDRIVSKGLTLVPEGRRVFPDLTVLENLKIGAYLRTDSLEDDLNWVYDLFPRLKERSWQAAGTLSGGEQQMLAVGRALMSRPKIIMMDEPSLGLAPIVVKGIFDIIQEINRQGVTVLLIEQNANMALKIADVGYVLETGRISLTGSGRELLANEAVKKPIWAADHPITLGALETERLIFCLCCTLPSNKPPVFCLEWGSLSPPFNERREQHEFLWKPMSYRRRALRDGPAGARPTGSTGRYSSGSLPPWRTSRASSGTDPRSRGSASCPPGTASRCGTSSTARLPGAARWSSR